MKKSSEAIIEPLAVFKRKTKLKCKSKQSTPKYESILEQFALLLADDLRRKES
ncbi:hypothetical protein MUP77_24965 [Candidatus Bathyarchaeota archaeon]|nr:hypothetical protein [Candidatus Bathyarchaeota archaeon]